MRLCLYLIVCSFGVWKICKKFNWNVSYKKIYGCLSTGCFSFVVLLSHLLTSL